MAFICGSHAKQEDDFEAFWSLPSSPQRKVTRRRNSFCSKSNKDSKNPYSDRGLDKFEALLADLEGKRQKIYTQKGSEDISLVRFVYSNSNHVKPIVVKIKDHKKQEKDHNLKLENTKTPVLSPEHPVADENKKTVVVESPKPSISFGQLRRKFGEWWRPWYSLPLFVILILLFLVFFGRSFAILCTSLGWYLVPSINETFENTKRPKKIVKKEYSRKFSEKITTSPKSPRSVLNNVPLNNQSAHRKSF